MNPVVTKVFAYITHQNRLLVFRHVDFPEAGIQVPAGTVRDNEDLATAVLREAQEETGLTELTIHAYLGQHIRSMEDVGKDEIHHRHFYHLLCGGEPPERWQHDETDPSNRGPAPIRFEFFWAAIPGEVPKLICDHGILLSLLQARLKPDEPGLP